MKREPGLHAESAPGARESLANASGRIFAPGFLASSSIARLHLACVVDPALQVIHEILQDKDHPQRLAAAKEVLERNRLYAFGVEPPARGACPPAVSVQTQVNLPEARVTEMSDADLEAYDRLLTELKELLPKDEPKRIGSVSR
jgi:hypothetical protein